MARILIVEDERNSAEVAAIICQAAGHEVVLASNGLEAWETMQDHDFDLLLVDLRMPLMDGVALSRRVRSVGRSPHMPILVVTARVTGRDRADLAGIGVTDVILKPYSTRTLARAVEALLARPAAQPVASAVELVRVWERLPILPAARES